MFLKSRQKDRCFTRVPIYPDVMYLQIKEQVSLLERLMNMDVLGKSKSKEIVFSE